MLFSIPGRLIQWSQTRATPPLELKRLERDLNEGNDRCVSDKKKKKKSGTFVY